MIKKIPVQHLEVGMFVQDFNVPWVDHPFLTNKKLVKSSKEIRFLTDHGVLEVYIDTARGLDSPKAVCALEAQTEIRQEMTRALSEGGEGPEDPGDGATRAFDAIPFEEELRRARGIYGRAKQLVKNLLNDARMGKAVDGEQTARLVDDMVESIFRNQDALASMSRLKSFDDYTFQHSINVSVLSLTLGRHMGILKEELRRLGIGAILHDVGKMMVPEALLNKPGRLDVEEFAVMRTHTLHGARLLMAARDVPDESAAVALNHHERFNGRGYPRAIHGLAIGKFGLISAIADVYDAITTDRVYHKGLLSHQALQKIYEWTKTDFHPLYVQKFIQCLGIYPVGSAVRLSTGEIGVVCRQNHGQLLHPFVKLVRDAAGSPADPPGEVDLTDPGGGGEGSLRRTVQTVLDPAAVGVDVEAVLTRPSP